MCLPIFRRTIGILMIAFILCACGVFPVTQTSAINTFDYQAKVLDKSGNPITSQLIMTVSLWTTATRGTNDYKTDKTVDTTATGYVYHGSYTVTPNSFGVVTIEVGSGAYPLPNPLPNEDMYMDVQIRLASEGTDKNDLMDKRNKATGVLSAITSQLNAGLGGIASGDLIVYDSSTKEFRGAKGVDMSTTNLKLSFGNNLTKKILVEWDITNNWWTFSNPMNFTGGLYLNGVDITTLFGGGGGGGLGTFVGATSITTMNGNFSYGGKIGYDAGHAACNAEFAGSHMCAASEIDYTIRQNPTSYSSETGWIIEGSPGFTANGNDCNGWTNNASSNYYGAFWIFNSSGGGAGWLAPCNNTKSLLCCL